MMMIDDDDRRVCLMILAVLLLLLDRGDLMCFMSCLLPRVMIDGDVNRTEFYQN